MGFQNSRLFKKKKRKHESPTETKRERINVLNGRPHAGEYFFLFNDRSRLTCGFRFQFSTLEAEWKRHVVPGKNKKKEQ